MKAEGTASKTPLKEAFGQWKNAKIALFALLGLVAGQAVVWYTGQFYALFYLQSILKVDQFTANVLIAWSLTVGTVFFLFFGWLSDKIGRKPIILGGCLVAAVTFFPLFKLLTRDGQPGAAQGAAEHQGGRHRRPGQVLVPVQPGRHRQVHVVLRHHEGAAGAQLGAVLDRRWRTRLDRQGDDRRHRDPRLRREQAERRRSEAVPAAYTKAINDALTKAGYPGKDNPSIVKIPIEPEKGLANMLKMADVFTPQKLDDHRHPDPARHLRDGGVRPDRRRAGRVLPDPHPLLGPFAAVPHRQRLVRRPAAGDRVRDGRGHRRHLLRPVVPGRHRADDGGARRLPGARDVQAGHPQDLSGAPLAQASAACRDLRRRRALGGEQQG